METGLTFAGGLEVRREGRRRRIRGRFPYNSTAVVADRGRQRKETFAPHSLRFAIEDTERPIHLLHGHSYDRPLAVRAAAPAPLPATPAPDLVAPRAAIALLLTDTDEAVEFETEELPEDTEELPVYYQDVLKLIDLGLTVGLSPGFVVPPVSVVPGAEELVPEPRNESVLIRLIREAVLYELSIVTRPAYRDSSVDLRAEDFRVMPRKVRVWL